MAHNLIRWVLFTSLYSLLALLSFQSWDAWSLSTTQWFPAPLLFAVLWLTSILEWPQWLATAGLLHIFIGAWVGRSLPLATFFAVSDIVVFPFAVIAFRYSSQLMWCTFASHPIARELICITVLVLCTFCGSTLLSLCLLLAGYPVVLLHLLTWALAALTGVLAILPLLRGQNALPLSIRQIFGNWQMTTTIIANITLQIALFFTSFGHLLQGFNPLFIQTTFLILSVFMLSSRGLGVILIAQYLIVILATQQGKGLFFTLMPAVLPATWQAEWYLIFSAILANCLHQYQSWMHRRQRQAESTNALLSRFVQYGGGMVFRLEMPLLTLHWQSNTETVFPGESQSISTLELLEAHCDEPFVSAFLNWHARDNETIFEREINLQRLNGQQTHCLLAILRIPDAPYLMGGICPFFTGADQQPLTVNL